MVYLANGFSLSMLPPEALSFVRIKAVTPMDVPKGAKSIIGHCDTASILSNLLGWTVPVNRETISVKEGDTVYIANYVGERLPEGATTLPKGAQIKFFELSLRENGCRGCHGYDDGSCIGCPLSVWLSGHN